MLTSYKNCWESESVYGAVWRNKSTLLVVEMKAKKDINRQQNKVYKILCGTHNL